MQEVYGLAQCRCGKMGAKEVKLLEKFILAVVSAILIGIAEVMKNDDE